MKRSTAIPNWLFEIKISPLAKWAYTCLLYVANGSDIIVDTKANIIEQVREMGVWLKPQTLNEELDDDVPYRIRSLHLSGLIGIERGWTLVTDEETWTITLPKPTKASLERLKHYQKQQEVAR